MYFSMPYNVAGVRTIAAEKFVDWHDRPQTLSCPPQKMAQLYQEMHGSIVHRGDVVLVRDILDACTFTCGCRTVVSLSLATSGHGRNKAIRQHACLIRKVIIETRRLDIFCRELPFPIGSGILVSMRYASDSPKTCQQPSATPTEKVTHVEDAARRKAENLKKAHKAAQRQRAASVSWPVAML
ncbi:hypothetical protein B0H21DRAFT_712224 [Amylocystis lapponica]|nr:hypothetical protein B0H21DRAFT_712224 [Amylocystis lapponica]